jgi:hypothetical protein
MATLYPAPNETAIEALLDGLVSVSTHVSRKEAADPERDATGVFAEFVTDDDQLAVLGFADPDVVNFVGGAMIGLEVDALTAAGAKAMVLDDSLEGFREVVNVFASCLNSDFTPHLRLANVHILPGQLTDDVKQLWRQPRARRAYSVSVEEHGTGVIILYFS